MSTPLLNSPFYQYIKAHAPTAQWDEWGGYTCALNVGELDDELKAVRTNAVVFDMSPVVKFRIKGDDAVAYMNTLTTRQMDINVGRVTYTCWCNEQGKLIDDGTAFRVADDEFILMPGENREAYYQQVAEKFNVTVSDITHEFAGLTLQGKKSLSIIQALGVVGLEQLKPFHFADYQTEAGSIRISRTGFFGDLGYELWLDSSQAEFVWDGIVKAGVTPCGIDTLCNARLEAGLIIPEGDFEFEPFDPMLKQPHDFNRSPFEMDLGFLVNFKKGDFIGREALLAEHEQGSVWANVGLELEGIIAAEHGDEILINGECVGFISSGLYSVSIEKNIALASVKTSHSAVATKLVVNIKGQQVNASIVKKPFINPERKSQTPAPAL